MKRPPFLLNPHAWVATQRQQHDPRHYSAGSVYRPSVWERIYWWWAR